MSYHYHNPHYQHQYHNPPYYRAANVNTRQVGNIENEPANSLAKMEEQFVLRVPPQLASQVLILVIRMLCM